MVELQVMGPGGQVITKVAVEVADTPGLRRKGLSKRAELPEGRGMLFDKVGAYWMKDVNFPLDIVFLDKEGEVLEKQHMPMLKHANAFRSLYVPESTSANLAVELPAGWFDSEGIRVGDRFCVSKARQ